MVGRTPQCNYVCEHSSTSTVGDPCLVSALWIHTANACDYGFCLQEYSGDALTQKIQQKLASIPDIAEQITQQQGGLGLPPSTTDSAISPDANTAGIIAGTVVGFGVSFGLVILGLTMLHNKRKAASASDKPCQDQYAVGGEQDLAAGPVAEGSEPASTLLHRRSIRVNAFLQAQASPDSCNKTK